MPIYSYKCSKCGKEADEIRCVTDRNNGPKCEQCKRKMTLQISAVQGIVKNPAVPRGRRA